MSHVMALVALMVLGCASGRAEEANESRQVQAIVRTTQSPFCPGKTLDSCPSPRAAQWRRDVHAWVGEGLHESEIRERLQGRAPSFDLSLPPVKSGWAIPVLAVALATSWLIIVSRALSRPPPPRRGGRPVRYTPLDARIDEELSALD